MEREVIYLGSESSPPKEPKEPKRSEPSRVVIDLLSSSPPSPRPSVRPPPPALPPLPRLPQQVVVPKTPRKRGSSPCQMSPRFGAFADSSPLGLSVRDSKVAISSLPDSDDIFTLSPPTIQPPATERISSEPKPTPKPLERKRPHLSSSPLELTVLPRPPQLPSSESPEPIPPRKAHGTRDALPEPISRRDTRDSRDSRDVRDTRDTPEDAPTPPDMPNSPPAKPKRARRATTQKSVKIHTDRKKTACELVATLCGDTQDWESQLRPALEEHSITVQTDTHRIPGTSLVVQMKREVSSTWDANEQLFVPCAPFQEPTPEALVVLDYKAFEEMVERPIEGQRAFFDRIALALPATTTKLIYLAPDVRKRTHRRTAQYNSQVRRHVLSQMSQEELSPLAEPFDLNDAELRLQAVLDLKIIYPRSDQDCVEWLVNLAIDTAYSRYQSRYMALGSKSTSTGSDAQECAVEALTQIRGVAPRQAANLVARFRSVGGLIGSPQAGSLAPTLTGLISDNVRQTIVALFESTDPDKVV